MDSNKIERTLQSEMDDLLDAVKTSFKLTDSSLVREKSFRNNPETGKLEGYTSAKFLIDPSEEETMNSIIADFEEFYKEELYVKSSYMGSDVDVNKVTVALGVNGPEDYTRLKEAEKASGRRI